MALDAASYPALWAIYAKTGIRPEYLLPVLQAESGLNPATPNLAGEPFYGINQASTILISQFAGVTPAVYLTWPASQQLSTVVAGYLGGLVAQYGALNSGTRVYQANFLPATLPAATQLTDIVTAAPSPYYTHNAGLDPQGKGAITLQDLANFVTKALPGAQAAIANAYAVAPVGVGPQQDPIYGTDFGGGAVSLWRPVVGAIAILGLAGAIAYSIGRE